MILTLDNRKMILSSEPKKYNLYKKAKYEN
jgi:hypothetical protein